MSDIETADADISWIYTGNTDLTVVINSSNVATITAPVDWNGSELITFTADDDGIIPITDFGSKRSAIPALPDR